MLERTNGLGWVKVGVRRVGEKWVWSGVVEVYCG